MTASLLYCTTCGAANSTEHTVCFACQQALTESATETTNISLLHNRYRLLTQVGTGGFGAVYKALDTLLANSTVAIKQINLHGLSTQQVIEATETFHREVGLLSGLNHPHLPRIHEHFTDPEHWYLVMDFVEGETLEYYLTEQIALSSLPGTSSLPLDEVFDIGLQLCTVLDYLHTRQPPIIFRDLKPSNILRTAHGHLFLIDFGIARYFKPGQAKDTIPFGSPGYAAPEQYGKAQTTPRADIYSLGALLHQLLSGDDPSETPFSFAPLRLYGGEVMHDLEALILRMVQVEADKRPEHIKAVKHELERLHTLHVSNAQPRVWYATPGQMPPWVSQGQTSSQYWQSTASGSAQQQQQILNTPSNPSRRRLIRNMALGTLVVMATGGSIGLLQNLGNRGPMTHSYPPVPLKVLTVVWAVDGKHVAFGDTDGMVEIWNVDKYAPDPHQYSQKGSTLAWSPDGKRIASTDGSSGTVEIWDVTNGQILSTYTGHVQSPSALAWSPNGAHIAVGGWFSVEVLDATNGNSVFMHQWTHYHGEPEPVHPIIWSPDSKRIAFGDFDTGWAVPSHIEVWDVSTTQQITDYLGHTGAVHGIAWSPDGKQIVSSDLGIFSSGKGSVQVWDVETGKTVFTYRGSSRVQCVAWSPDGKHIASADDQGVQVWDARNGSHVTTLTSRPGLATHTGAITWSSDSKRIFLARDDRTIQVWKVR